MSKIGGTMGGRKVFMMGHEELSDEADLVKTVILEALVLDKFMTLEQAETWAKSHTILAKRKPFFRTLSQVWNRFHGRARSEGEIGAGSKIYYLVVKKY